ncbi:MAG: septation regulator SpoVG [Candidatus Latescibacteria bacterium]|nr:septation regulator SpoVG [Candidatus Latescibacterota bacterium]NIM21124.1 septation regulator SpoVG [Candidatus Latescibacterota bacterium]NIM65259.1 septation regulator SpoVG [Candidatus Latescibacterota bacterium]NIO01774.1 septation regulator SpoVG [Candidatus Latescibacterota bacterium]NIO28291.1 septation regulator SpoVG [Candidatus Latescibacterota bacterium]
MDITEVRISLRSDAKLKAFVSITFDNCFVIRGLKIIQGANGIFVAMPSRKRKDGEYQDIAHPINNETRRWMEEIILSKYQEVLAASEGTPPSSSSEDDEEGEDSETPPHAVQADKNRGR